MTHISGRGFPGSIEDHNQVSGPVTITYHPNVMGSRDIYIFGDIHLENDGLCQMIFDNKPIEIVEFFDKIFHNSDIPLDFFLEIPVISLNKAIPSPPLSIPIKAPPQNGPMVRLREKFENCFDGTLMNECERRYPKTIFHSMDIRQKTNDARNNGKLTFFTQYSHILSSIASDCQTNTITKLISANKDQIPKSTKEELINKMGKLLLLFNNNEIIKIIKDYIRIPHRDIKFNPDNDKEFEYYEQFEYPGINQIKERIDRLSYVSKKKLLHLFDQRSLMILKSYKEMQESIEENWKIVLSHMNKDETKEDKSLQEAFMKLCDLVKFKSLIMFNIDGLFFDITNLAKILNILNDENTWNGEIWIYLGEGHAEVFRNFIISNLNNHDYYKSNSIAERCQDIKIIKSQASKNKNKK
jgi:hypothetical protein